MSVEHEIAGRKHVHPNGIIEVTRCIAIDRNNVQVSEVPAAVQFPAGNHCGNLLGLIDHLGRETVRKVVLADDDFHTPHRVLSVPGVPEQLRVHDHAIELARVRDFERRSADAVGRA